MTFELCIPARNEAPTIVEALRLLSAAMPQGLEWSIVVVENGSTDGTAETIEREHLPHVRVLRILESGKGRAVRYAASQSSADVFAYMDADLSVDPSEIPTLLAQLSEGADIVAGSRLMTSSHVDRTPLRSLSSVLFSLVARRWLSVPVRDTQCGCKFMNRRGREILASGKEDGWFFDLEFLARASQAGLIILEHPIRWTETRFLGRKSQLNMLTDSFRGFQAIWRIRERLKENTAIGSES